jgi:hypothetical protein
MRTSRLTGSALAAAAALALAAPASAQYTEVQISTANFGSVHFDWARDGISCPSCNFGSGNSRFEWDDKAGNQWIGNIDPNTAAITPENGKAQLVDNSAFWWEVYGNSAEWAFSTQNGEVISQLVYTRFVPGTSQISSNAGVALATQGADGWTPAFFPGAFGTTEAPMNTALPLPTQCNSLPIPLTLYKSLTKKAMYWEDTTTAAGTVPNLTPFGSYANGISERWVPCTHQLVFIGNGVATDGKRYGQEFWYDADTNLVEQLTTDPADHKGAFMWQAPEFGDQYVFFTLANSLTIQVYLQTGTAANGAPTFALINTITSPDPSQPIISTPEPFINCAPTCQSWIFATLGPANATSQTGNGLAVFSIDPAAPVFNILASSTQEPLSHRSDPEYFITSFGPILTYDRSAVGGGSSKHEGRFYIDMQLGTPSGACVGSSAEGGMVSGC